MLPLIGEIKMYIICCNAVGVSDDLAPTHHHQTFIDNLTRDPPSQYMAVIHKNYLL